MPDHQGQIIPFRDKWLTEGVLSDSAFPHLRPLADSFDQVQRLFGGAGQMAATTICERFGLLVLCNDNATKQLWSVSADRLHRFLSCLHRQVTATLSVADLRDRLVTDGFVLLSALASMSGAWRDTARIRADIEAMRQFLAQLYDACPELDQPGQCAVFFAYKDAFSHYAFPAALHYAGHRGDDDWPFSCGLDACSASSSAAALFTRHPPARASAYLLARAEFRAAVRLENATRADCLLRIASDIAKVDPLPWWNCRSALHALLEQLSPGPDEQAALAALCRAALAAAPDDAGLAPQASVMLFVLGDAPLAIAPTASTEALCACLCSLEQTQSISTYRAKAQHAVVLATIVDAMLAALDDDALALLEAIPAAMLGWIDVTVRLAWCERLTGEVLQSLRSSAWRYDTERRLRKYFSLAARLLDQHVVAQRYFIIQFLENGHALASSDPFAVLSACLASYQATQQHGVRDPHLRNIELAPLARKDWIDCCWAHIKQASHQSIDRMADLIDQLVLADDVLTWLRIDAVQLATYLKPLCRNARCRFSLISLPCHSTSAARELRLQAFQSSPHELYELYLLQASSILDQFDVALAEVERYVVPAIARDDVFLRLSPARWHDAGGLATHFIGAVSARRLAKLTRRYVIDAIDSVFHYRYRNSLSAFDTQLISFFENVKGQVGWTLLPARADDRIDHADDDGAIDTLVRLLNHEWRVGQLHGCALAPARQVLECFEPAIEQRLFDLCLDKLSQDRLEADQGYLLARHFAARHPGTLRLFELLSGATLEDSETAALPTLSDLRLWLGTFSTGLLAYSPGQRGLLLRANHLLQAIDIERLRRDVRLHLLAPSTMVHYWQLFDQHVLPLEREILLLVAQLSRDGMDARWLDGWQSFRPALPWTSWMRHPLACWRLRKAIIAHQGISRRIGEQAAHQLLAAVEDACRVIVRRRLAQSDRDRCLLNASAQQRFAIVVTMQHLGLDADQFAASLGDRLGAALQRQRLIDCLSAYRPESACTADSHGEARFAMREVATSLTSAAIAEQLFDNATRWTQGQLTQFLQASFLVSASERRQLVEIVTAGAAALAAVGAGRADAAALMALCSDPVAYHLRATVEQAVAQARHLGNPRSSAWQQIRETETILAALLDELVSEERRVLDQRMCSWSAAAQDEALDNRDLAQLWTLQDAARALIVPLTVSSDLHVNLSPLAGLSVRAFHRICQRDEGASPQAQAAPPMRAEPDDAQDDSEDDDWGAALAEQARSEAQDQRQSLNQRALELGIDPQQAPTLLARVFDALQAGGAPPVPDETDPDISWTEPVVAQWRQRGDSADSERQWSFLRDWLDLAEHRMGVNINCTERHCANILARKPAYAALVQLFQHRGRLYLLSIDAAGTGARLDDCCPLSTAELQEQLAAWLGAMQGGGAHVAERLDALYADLAASAWVGAISERLRSLAGQHALAVLFPPNLSPFPWEAWSGVALARVGSLAQWCRPQPQRTRRPAVLVNCADDQHTLVAEAQAGCVAASLCALQAEVRRAPPSRRLSRAGVLLALDASWIHIVLHGNASGAAVADGLDAHLRLRSDATGGRGAALPAWLLACADSAGAFIFLSSCESGLVAARGAGALDHFGIATALAMTACAVVAPLWPVSQATDLLLVDAFYQTAREHPNWSVHAVLAAARGRLAALTLEAASERLRQLVPRKLQQAPLLANLHALYAGRPTPPPYAWAAYVVFGEGDLPIAHILDPRPPAATAPAAAVPSAAAPQESAAPLAAAPDQRAAPPDLAGIDQAAACHAQAAARPSSSSAAQHDEMETKLDLSLAYLEIGDLEGARELADEVILGGDRQQVERAQCLRARMA